MHLIAPTIISGMPYALRILYILDLSTESNAFVVVEVVVYLMSTLSPLQVEEIF